MTIVSARMWRFVLVAFLFSSGCAFEHRYKAVERYGLLVVDMPRSKNDEPTEADLVTPGGATLHVEGYDEGERTIVRFGPRDVGRYYFVVRRGASELRRGTFEATPSSRGGPVRRDPKESHRLIRDDGSTFYMLGENRINVYDPSWNAEGLSGPEYIARMASYGMTTLRVFVFADIECEECENGRQPGALENGLGRYDPEVAARFDALIEAADAHDVQVILTLFSIGFTENETWKSWDDNPYGVARDGPAMTPQDFFTDKTARQYAAKRLRYVLARWGYSSHLMAIDLLNEPEWDGPIPEPVWIPWARELAKVAHAYDPYRRLITVGPVGLSWNLEGDERPWYDAPENQIVQWHLYGEPFYKPVNLAAEMTRRTRETWDFDRPVLCGEFGYGGEDKETYEHTHVGIWSATFSGAGVLSHTAPVFNIDSDGPMTRQRAQHFRVLRDFVEPLAKRWHAPRFDVEVKGPVSAWELSTDDGTSGALWLLADGKTRRSFDLRLPQAGPGRYRVVWIDDVTGTRLIDTEVTAAMDGLRLTSPAFTNHVAGRFLRL